MSNFEQELNYFILERNEAAYKELMKTNPEFVEVQEKIIEQEEKFMKNLSKKQTKRFFRIEECDSRRNYLWHNFIYMQGMKDCFSFLKKLEII